MDAEDSDTKLEAVAAMPVLTKVVEAKPSILPAEEWMQLRWLLQVWLFSKLQKEVVGWSMLDRYFRSIPWVVLSNVDSSMPMLCPMEEYMVTPTEGGVFLYLKINTTVTVFNNALFCFQLLASYGQFHIFHQESHVLLGLVP